MFENRVPRRISGPKRDEVMGRWRKLQHEKFHSFYSSPNITRVIKSRRVRWAGYTACMGKIRNAYTIFMGKLEGKRPLRRPGRKWEDNIKMDLRETGFGVWIGFIWLSIRTSGRLL
jgi:hypothetical protein